MKPRIRVPSNKYDDWLFFYMAWDGEPTQESKDIVDSVVLIDKSKPL